MLLTIKTTHRPATDLGYLLVKHPDKCQTFSLAYGKAHVFYPLATEEQCVAALLLDFDPVGLVRGRRWGPKSKGTLAHYVNDRPYAATSFLSVAIAQVLGTAMKGVSKDRQELADSPLPFEACLSVVPSRGGESFLRGLFGPLGYEVEAQPIPLDEAFPEWGGGSYYRLRLKADVRLADLLTHLYVLIPVLDNQKHYWVGEEEVEKLLDKAGDWLKFHPMREQITRRYLKHRSSLFRDALERLTAEDDPQSEEREAAKEREEDDLERPIGLNDQRIGAVLAVLKNANASRVLDLGCGEGKLVQALLKEAGVSRVVGIDVSMRSLEQARDRLKLDRMPGRQRKRVELFQGSLTYRDDRFSDCDAACAVEVVEHIDPSRLGAFERVLFEFAKPPLVVMTTPNVEYNVRFESLNAGQFRHRDHRFEWTRQEFQAWCEGVAQRHGYQVRFLPIGGEEAEVGPPTQMAVFEQ
ncbi:MAG TPA: 3' terminal RNA ribose 2'-O-methyltransferase Hen1 [Acidobacteriota bacterium]|nr:3' terminal RNA ribose 2'-O-methyltransferase Hen1 [Acidobacteriota bacterium]